MVRVWFNHWFSTSYNIIHLLKEDTHTCFYVIGSNQKKFSVIQNACDEWYEEPALDGEDYVNYCLEFCKIHCIELFIPRRKMVDISKNIEQFRAIGVNIMVDEYQYISILNNKAKAYELLKTCGHIQVPDFYVVNTVPEFQKAYDVLLKQYKKVCLKFVKDEGGMSFRIIENDIDQFEALCQYPDSQIAYKDLVGILSEKEKFKDMLVMPYLPDDEISVDCLMTEHGLIAIPRVKGSSRDEKVEFQEDVLKMCEEILSTIPLQCPCNIQFKILDGVKYLLEINTRMSGGIQMSCLATGTNIPNIAAHKALGESVKWSMDKKEKRVTYVEMPQLIK